MATKRLTVNRYVPGLSTAGELRLCDLCAVRNPVQGSRSSDRARETHKPPVQHLVHGAQEPLSGCCIGMACNGGTSLCISERLTAQAGSLLR